MIGNDIVDLNQAQKDSNWNRKGYMEKIFTPSEQFLISSAKNPSIMVWLLWSMKESAYKIRVRETKLRTFAPAMLICNNLILHKKTATGNVLYEGEMYFTRSMVEKNYIHTVAALHVELLYQVKIKITDYNQSDTAYRATNPTSVSHHGNYLALAYL